MSDYIVNQVFNSITYILPVGNQKECWLVDCGDVEKIISQGWNIRGVFLTHTHTDHIYGINKLIDTFPDALIYTNEEGKKGLLNPKLNFSRYHEEVDDFIISNPDSIIVIESEGALVVGDTMKVEVIFTPGHDPSCLSYVIDNFLFTGDSYIPGYKVVCNFPKSNRKLAKENEQKLKMLESRGYEVMAGHSSEE